jgi:hypothetical protein
LLDKQLSTKKAMLENLTPPSAMMGRSICFPTPQCKPKAGSGLGFTPILLKRAASKIRKTQDSWGRWGDCKGGSFAQIEGTIGRSFSDGGWWRTYLSI